MAKKSSHLDLGASRSRRFLGNVSDFSAEELFSEFRFFKKIEAAAIKIKKEERRQKDFSCCLSGKIGRHSADNLGSNPAMNDFFKSLTKASVLLMTL